MLKQWLFKVAGVQWHSSHWYCASFSLFWCISWCILSSISVLTTPYLKQPLFWTCVFSTRFCLVRHNMLKQWLFKVAGVRWHSSHSYCATFALFWCISWCILSSISVLTTPNLKQPLFWTCVFSIRFCLVRHNMLKQWLCKVAGVQGHSSHWYCASFSMFCCISWCILSSKSVLTAPNLKQPLGWICVFSTRFYIVRHNMLKQTLFKVAGVQWHSPHWYCASFALFGCICWCILSSISVLTTPDLKQPLFWLCVFATRFCLVRHNMLK
jgi:hypothetical protein